MLFGMKLDFKVKGRSASKFLI